jgi:hypothetical protein
MSRLSDIQAGKEVTVKEIMAEIFFGCDFSEKLIFMIFYCFLMNNQVQ